MEIRMTCPAGHSVYVDETLAGAVVRCPQCEATDAVLRSVAEGLPSTPAAPRGDAVRLPATAAPPARTPRTVKRSAWQPLEADEAVAGMVRRLQWHAAGLTLAVAASLTPLVRLQSWDVAASPAWARVLVMMATLQMAFLLWMLTAPDWASVRVVMLVFALAAALYGMATAAALTTPLDHPMLLGLGALRRAAVGWCAAMLLLMALAAYLSGRLSARWRRQLEAA
jgi:hypothetical protein